VLPTTYYTASHSSYSNVNASVYRHDTICFSGPNPASTWHSIIIILTGVKANSSHSPRPANADQKRRGSERYPASWVLHLVNDRKNNLAKMLESPIEQAENARNEAVPGSLQAYRIGAATSSMIESSYAKFWVCISDESE